MILSQYTNAQQYNHRRSENRYHIINKLASNFALLLVLSVSACNHSYKPLAHITETSMKEAGTESYATLKNSVKELRNVFLPSKDSQEEGQ